MRRNIIMVLALGLLLALLAACAGGAGPAESGGDAAAADAPADVISLALSTASEPVTLDPNLASDYYSTLPIEQMFLGLTNINNATSEIEPELATSWESSEDGLTWTFTMRDDVMWSDGNPVTANDVEYSVKRAIMPETASPYAYVLYIIENAATINQTAIPTDTYDIDTLGVTAIDDYTVQFTLESPAPYFESISSLWTLRPVPSWAIEEYGDAWTEPENIVTNGPYKITDWSLGESLSFVKNPDYFDADNVQIEEITVDIITDQFTEVALYESGELDVAGENAGSFSIEELLAHPR